MGKVKMLTRILVGFVLSFFVLFAHAETNKQDSFSLVHWNILKNMYKINGYVYKHHLTTEKLSSAPDFVKILSSTFTPDSYAALLDKNAILYLHPDKSVLGKNLRDITGGASAYKIIKVAIKNDTCSRGFYLWIDKEEKYMVVCPIIGTTKEGNKLFYVYTMYTRSMPDYYLKTLKNSAQE